MEIHSNTVSEIAKALAKAQGEFDSAKKSSVNPHFRSKYADLSAIWDALRDVLPRFELCVTQTLMPNDNGKVFLITTLIHSSGEWFKSYYPLLIEKENSQGMGSAVSYARRYSLAAICGITQEDDDGNLASLPKQTPVRQKSPADTSDDVYDESVFEGITLKEAQYLTELLSKCPAKAQEKFNEILKNLNLNDACELSKKTYNSLLPKLKESAEKHQKSLSENVSENN